MAESIFSGPVVSMGALTATTVNPSDGPSIEYQGNAFPDTRFSPMNKDGLSPGRVPSFFDHPNVVLVDAIPSANGTVNVAIAQAPSTIAGVALTLVTTTVGTAAGVPVWATGVPIIPVGTSVATTVSVIDFGFATGTTAANSSTVIVDDNTKFTLGQWICVGGGAAVNRPLFTQVAAFSTNANSSIIFISPVAGTTASHLPIGQGNLYSQFLPPATQFGPSAASANAVEPYKLAGVGKMYDPAQGVTRALCVSAASIGSGTTNLLATGYDIYGNLMTEYLSCNGTTVVNGKKAFKYILSVVTASTAATTVTPANVQVGVSDVFGLNLRVDRWEYLQPIYNAGTVATASGWTAALSTTSTATTADVRGTYNASTFGGGTVASTNGARRLTIQYSVPLYNMVNATPINGTSLFGAAQA